MPRIPYQPLDLAEPKELVDRIRQRRGGTLLNLDRQLLHSPAFASGWNTFLGEVRNHLSLSPKLKEIAMCVVAVLNQAIYEFHHHAPEYIKAGGSPEQVEGLKAVGTPHYTPHLFDAAEQAAIQLTLEMTRHIRVSDETFAAALKALPNQQAVVELIGVAATYNMVSRFLVALEIEPE
jgi:alkylhydroperoxidase family enzyme